MTVEVFKTNITDQHTAGMLVAEIHETFDGYKANFDLEDCDRILRIQCDRMDIKCSLIISFLNNLGYKAEVLVD